MAKSLNFFKAGNEKSKMQVSVSHDLRRLYSLSANNIQKEIDRLPKDGASSGLNRRRLLQLQTRINEIIDELSDETEEIIKDSLLEVNEKLVEEQKSWLKSKGFDIRAVNMVYASVPEELVERMVAGEIYEGGWNLSDAIWGDNEYTKKDLYSIVAQGMVENKGLYEIASDLERYVNPNKITMWNFKMTDGRKIFKKKVEYNAQRLARTLMQHSYQQGVIETTKDNPFVKKWVWVANGSRACPICKERDGAVYTDPEDIPMDHPNGMCVIDVVESDTFVDDLRDWYHAEDGEYPEIDEFAKKFGYEPNNAHGTTKDDIIDIGKVLYDKEFMTELEQALELYVGGGYQSPKDALTDAQYECILSQLEEFDGIAYRLESRQYTLDKQNLSVGDTFSFDDNLRSFSTDRDYVDRIIESILWEEIPMENPVMFKTEGKVDMFNMRDFTKAYFEDQSEAFLGGEWEILSIKTQVMGDLDVDVVTIRQRKSPLDILDDMLDNNNTPTLREFYTKDRNYIHSKDNQWQFDFSSDVWWNGLTEKEKDAVRMYTGARPRDTSHFPGLEFGVDYRALNGAIRLDTGEKELYDEYIKVLDDTLSKHALKNDSIFYRGISKEELDDILNKKEMPEYKSLTADKTVVNSFSQNGYSMEIRVPKEADGGYIGQYSKFRLEKEFLLGRGTKVEIIDYDEDERILHVEVIAQTQR